MEQASEDTAGQRKYYTEHVGKYKAGNRVEARIFMTPDKIFFDQILARIVKGDSITAADVKKFKSVQNAKAWERGDSKVIDKANWVPGIQEVESTATIILWILSGWWPRGPGLLKKLARGLFRLPGRS